VYVPGALEKDPGMANDSYNWRDGDMVPTAELAAYVEPPGAVTIRYKVELVAARVPTFVRLEFRFTEVLSDIDAGLGEKPVI
jgi:hypothetical protein